MQLLPSLTRDPKVIAQEASAGEHLPYARHVDDRTIETRDGLLLQTIRLSGLLFETAETAELNYRATLRDAMLRALGSSRFAIYHHVIRRRTDAQLKPVTADEFSAKLDARWQDKLAGKQLYVNELYLTIVRRPLQGKLGVASSIGEWFSSRGPRNAQSLATERKVLDRAREAVMAALGSYEPQVLEVYNSPEGRRSAPLEFLSYLFNGEVHPVAMPCGDLGHFIPSRRISFGQDAAELSGRTAEARRYAAMVSIKDYPGTTFPGMLDDLGRLPFELVVSQSFALVERREALGSISLVLRRMRSTEDEAISLRDELSVAKDEVAAGRAGFGEHHTTIAVYSDKIELLDGHVAEVIALLADLGINAVREDIALEPAFWAQFPGNFRYIGRRGLVSTANFAGLASLHNFPVGTAQGNHWGDAVTLFETTSAGPYFFNFHRQDLGNFTVIGPSGSGKTVVLNFLLAQARRFKPRIVFFDKDRGAELFIRAIGGQYDRLRPGARSGLNPLQLDNTPANRQFLMEWLTLLASGVSAAEKDQIRDAIDTNFLQPMERRRLCFLVELFRGSARPEADDLYSRLRSWWGEGEHAWLFDNPEDQTDLSAETVGFDMTAILDDPGVRTPAMYYFFHRVEQRLDGTPSIIVIDEGWKALDDEVFVRRIKDWEKTIRKRNGVIGFATQSAQDALKSKIASAIIEQAATQIFMINPKARAEDYMDGFGLSAHEFDLVRSMPDTSRCFLIRRGKESVVARLDLSGESEILAVLSGRETTVRAFDDIIDETGAVPSDWLPQLLEKVS